MFPWLKSCPLHLILHSRVTYVKRKYEHHLHVQNIQELFTAPRMGQPASRTTPEWFRSQAFTPSCSLFCVTPVLIWDQQKMAEVMLISSTMRLQKRPCALSLLDHLPCELPHREATRSPANSWWGSEDSSRQACGAATMKLQWTSAQDGPSAAPSREAGARSTQLSGSRTPDHQELR